MKLSQSAALAFAASALAAPSSTTPMKPRQTSACASAVTLDASTNVWKKYKLHANNFYRKEVEAAVAQISDSSLAAQAAKVADVGSFLWLDTIANIGKLEPALVDVPCEEILGLVIYDLPGRDCAAKASNGELKVGELSRYKTEYIDSELPNPWCISKEGGLHWQGKTDATRPAKRSSAFSRRTPTRLLPSSSSPTRSPTWSPTAT